jgi:WD40 repeat protein
MQSELFVSTIDGGPTLSIWEVFAGKRVKVFKDNDAQATYTHVLNHPAGISAVVGTDDGRILLWGFHVPEGAQRKAVYVPEGFNDLAISSSGILLAAAIRRQVAVYKMSSFEMESRFVGHAGDVYAIAFEPGRDVVLSGGSEGMLYRWNARNAQQIRGAEGHNAGIISISPSFGYAAVTASAPPEEDVILWNMICGDPMVRIQHKGNITHTALCSETKQIFVADSSGRVSKYSIDTGKGVQFFDAHNESITGLWCSPLGDLAITAGLDGYVRLWNVEDGTLIKETDTDTGVLSMAVFPEPPKLGTQ